MLGIGFNDGLHELFTQPKKPKRPKKESYPLFGSNTHLTYCRSGAWVWGIVYTAIWVLICGLVWERETAT